MRALEIPRLRKDGAEPAGRGGSRELRPEAEIAKQLYRLRRVRDESFSAFASIFRDPAWDMMLDLYAAELEGRRTSVGSATIAARVPHTTALRVVDEMASMGLLVRVPDPTDARRIFLRLTPIALERMSAFVGKLRR